MIEAGYIVGAANVTTASAHETGKINYELIVDEHVPMGQMINFSIGKSVYNYKISL